MNRHPRYSLLTASLGVAVMLAGRATREEVKAAAELPPEPQRIERKRPVRVLTAFDHERIRLAEVKRERKAAKLRRDFARQIEGAPS